MNTMRWRRMVERVAVVHGVFVSMFFVYIVHLLENVVWHRHTLKTKFRLIVPEMTSREANDAINVGYWVILGLFMFVLAVDVVAWWKLWVSSKPECERITASKNARIWRNVRIVYLIPTVICVIYFPTVYKTQPYSLLGMLVIAIICDLIGIGVVQMFIIELHTAAAAQAN